MMKTVQQSDHVATGMSLDTCDVAEALQTRFLERLCRNILQGRFKWKKYLSAKSYFGHVVQTEPLHVSYGQIGFTVSFADPNLPEIAYD